MPVGWPFCLWLFLLLFLFLFRLISWCIGLLTYTNHECADGAAQWLPTSAHCLQEPSGMYRATRPLPAYTLQRRQLYANLSTQLEVHGLLAGELAA